MLSNCLYVPGGISVAIKANAEKTIMKFKYTGFKE